MSKKYYILCTIGLFVCLTAITIIVLQNRISHQINKNGDSLPIIDNILEKKYTKKEEGKDSNGNSFITLYYNPKDLDESYINSFEIMLCEEFGFNAYDGENMFEEGIKYVGNSTEKGKMWVITIYYDVEEAYVNYTKISNTLFNENQGIINESVDELNDKIDERYFDPETNETFDDYEDYEDYTFYKDFDEEYTPEFYDDTADDSDGEELKDEQDN